MPRYFQCCCQFSLSKVKRAINHQPTINLPAFPPTFRPACLESAVVSAVSLFECNYRYHAFIALSNAEISVLINELGLN